MVSRSHAFALVLLLASIAAPVARAAPQRAPSADQSAVLQAVLDHARLRPFLHPESPGRVPVIVFIRGAAADISAQKFGAPVRVLTTDSRLQATVIRLTRFSVTEDTAEVALAYPAEGVQGSFTLRRAGSVWRVTDAEVHER